MAEKISRREFHGKMIAGTAAVALSGALPAQTKKPTPAELQAEADLKTLEARLEKSLPAKWKPTAKAALRNLRTAANERLKFKLPEGSEPCTAFAATPPRSRES